MLYQFLLMRDPSMITSSDYPATSKTETARSSALSIESLFIMESFCSSFSLLASSFILCSSATLSLIFSTKGTQPLNLSEVTSSKLIPSKNECFFKSSNYSKLPPRRCSGSIYIIESIRSSASLLIIFARISGRGQPILRALIS